MINIAEETLISQPYLSVVATSRNDDHGGDPLIRTQIFITSFARQCDKYKLPSEIIIVDWNPVPGRPGLAAVLQLPAESTFVRAYVITVPTALHKRLKYSAQLPLFQMIAKNVGIRRAKGQFILATNIDILFSDELIRFLALQRLDKGKQYRVDRYDIQSGLTREASLDETIEYAWAHPVRTNRRYRPRSLIRHLYGEELFKKHCNPRPEFCGKIEGVTVVQENGVWQVRPERAVNMSYLHTNACGDFTLLSREGWETIRGYPEFAAYSFNIDSMGFMAAHYAGYEEVSLLPPCVCFHIEHGLGSGWTPEGEKKLFNRLRDAGILNPEWPVLLPLVEKMRANGKALEFNHQGWGMADFDLPVQAMGDTASIPSDRLERLAVQAETHGVSAIQPDYDLDCLTLAHERDSVRKIDIVLYVPDSEGRYSEDDALGRTQPLREAIAVDFRVERYAHRFPLRLDPCAQRGLVGISLISVSDVHCRTILELVAGDARKLKVGGTAYRMSNALLEMGQRLRRLFLQSGDTRRRPAINLLSTGADPQVYLPKLPENAAFPLTLRIEMTFTPFALFRAR